MGLKKAKLSGTTSESGLGLQHEAAMRVEARYLAEEKKRRHAQLIGRLKNLFLFLFLLIGGGGGFYAWRTGMFDAIRSAFGLEHVDSGQEKGLTKGEDAVVETSVAPAKVQNETPAVKQRKESVEAPGKPMELFAGATVAYWKDAVSADKPSPKGQPLMYTALVPDAKGGCDFLKILLAGNNSMKVQRIAPPHEVDVPRAEFNKMVESTPYLVMREGRAYYCSAGKPVRQTGFAVPRKGEVFNPSRLEFGALYDLVFKAKLARPAFKYDVFLDHEHLKKKIPVATVEFGEEVAREFFEAAARAAVDDDEVVAVLLDTAKVGFASAK